MVGEADRGAVIHEVEVGADSDPGRTGDRLPSLSTTVTLRVSVIEPSVRLMMSSVNGAPVGCGSAVWSIWLNWVSVTMPVLVVETENTVFDASIPAAVVAVEPTITPPTL